MCRESVQLKFNTHTLLDIIISDAVNIRILLLFSLLFCYGCIRIKIFLKENTNQCSILTNFRNARQVYRMTKERNRRLDPAMHGKTNESVTARKVCLGGHRTVMAEEGEGGGGKIVY